MLLHFLFINFFFFLKRYTTLKIKLLYFVVVIFVLGFLLSQNCKSFSTHGVV